jgi:transcriptional regulator with XRE-family HTH domain
MDTNNAGARMRALREEFGLSQEDWARLLQVAPNTVARWEREELQPKGAHRKKVEQVLAITENAEAKETIKSTLKSEGGLAATAAFMGMLFGLLGALGVGMALVAPMLKSQASLLSGIMQYAKVSNKETVGKQNKKDS